MKESSCHDPKMEAYCKAVRRLEDKFDVLELNHVPRKYNEDADELAKIAAGRTTVPPPRTSLLATSPSPPSNSRIRRSQAPRPPGPPADEAEPMDVGFGTFSTNEAEAMEIDEAPTSQDWRAQYLDWMIRGVLPSGVPRGSYTSLGGPSLSS